MLFPTFHYPVALNSSLAKLALPFYCFASDRWAGKRVISPQALEGCGTWPTSRLNVLGKLTRNTGCSINDNLCIVGSPLSVFSDIFSPKLVSFSTRKNDYILIMLPQEGSNDKVLGSTFWHKIGLWYFCGLLHYYPGASTLLIREEILLIPFICDFLVFCFCLFFLFTFFSTLFCPPFNSLLTTLSFSYN